MTTEGGGGPSTRSAGGEEGGPPQGWQEGERGRGSFSCRRALTCDSHRRFSVGFVLAAFWSCLGGGGQRFRSISPRNGNLSLATAGLLRLRHSAGEKCVDPPLDAPHQNLHSDTQPCATRRPWLRGPRLERLVSHKDGGNHTNRTLVLESVPQNQPMEDAGLCAPSTRC